MALRGALQYYNQCQRAARSWSCMGNLNGLTSRLLSTPSSAEPHGSGKIEEAEPVDTNSQERKKLLVLGGNGFVGSNICREALHRGLPVVSLNRSGMPSIKEPWVGDVTWVQGDLLDPDPWKDILKEVSAVISCVGGFGSNEAMKRINGDANISSIHAACEAGVKRYVYISAADFGLPRFFLRGYYEGKRATESALRSKFPYGGVILKPGFIHGTRNVGDFQIPLSVIGAPLELALRNAKTLSGIPLIGQLLIPPVKVTSVARAAIRSATDNAVPPGVLDVWGIIRLGDH